MQTHVLEFRWTISRGRNTYGYSVCTLYVDGQKAARCNGGGYDMKGTVLGDWIARAFADRLLALKPEQMPEQGHWQRAERPRRICREVPCILADDPYLPSDVLVCPKCGKDTDIDYHDGQRVKDGHYFYGLTFHDPHYDPGKAIVGKDILDRALGKGAEGKTVEQAEQDGDSLGLERYQAFYRASSPIPTERHTVPLIDGATGYSNVWDIGRAIGLTYEKLPTRSKNLDLLRVTVSD